MSEVFCSNCGELFTPSSRHKNQTFCMKPQCRKAKKALWQRNKMKFDPDYRSSQKLSNKKWAASRPDYWRKYRENNPDKAERNRLLQTIRDRKRRSGREATTGDLSDALAKPVLRGREGMGVRGRGASRLAGRYWLIPISRKAAPLQAHIVIVSSA